MSAPAAAAIPRGRPVLVQHGVPPPAPPPYWFQTVPLPAKNSLDPTNWIDLMRIECLALQLRQGLPIFAVHALVAPDTPNKVNVSMLTFTDIPAAQEINAYLLPGWTCRVARTVQSTKDHPQWTALINKMVNTMARATNPGAVARIIGGQHYSETWPDWDLTHPTRHLKAADIADPPPRSILRLPAVREILATWERLSGPATMTYMLGPSPEHRLAAWSPRLLREKLDDEKRKLQAAARELGELNQGKKRAAEPGAPRAYVDWAEAEEPKRVRMEELVAHLESATAALAAQFESAPAVRRRLAAHLAAIPGVIMDMEHDPMSPWKGMKFFHGTRNAKLQGAAPAPFVHHQPMHRLRRMLVEADYTVSDPTTRPERLAHWTAEKKRIELEIGAVRALRGPALVARLAALRKYLDTDTRELAEDERNGRTDLAVSRRTIDELRREIAELQERVDREPAAAALDVPTTQVDRCKLSWGEWIDDQGRKRDGSAFLSPYYTKGFSYGGLSKQGYMTHIYTYTLRKEGKELRFLDLRNDYLKSTFNHAKFDPFRPIWELAGIPHVEDQGSPKLRDEKARNLYDLFHGSNVDGAIMNSDVEFVFFNPADLLEWRAPTSTLERTLLNTQTPPLLLEHQASALIAHVKHLITDEKLTAFLSDAALVHKREVKRSDLPFVRWSLDISWATYISQFAFTRSITSPLWVDSQFDPTDADEIGSDDDDPDTNLTLYECDYTKLWRHFAPDGELDNIWMADAIVEGGNAGVSRKTPLAYHVLSELMREMFEDDDTDDSVRLLVRLPNGYVQIVPTIQTTTLDHRMHSADIPEEHQRREDSFVHFVELPRRTAWKPVTTMSTLVSGVLEAAAAGSKRKDPASAQTEEEEAEEAARAKEQRHTGAGVGAGFRLLRV